MDPQEPPPAAPDMPGEVKGQRLFRLRYPLRSVGRKDLNAPNLMVHQPRTAAQRRAAFFCPPLASFIPAERFRADGIAAPGPFKGDRLAGRITDDVN